MSQGLSAIPGAVWGVFGTIIVAIIGWFGIIGKSRVDQNKNIMDSWEKMNAQHVEQTEKMNAAHLNQMQEAREQFKADVEDLREKHTVELRALRDEIIAAKLIAAEDSKRYRDAATEEIQALRKRVTLAEVRVTEIEAEFAEYRVKSARQILERDEIITGLQRNIVQSSQSAARQIGLLKEQSDTTDATVERHDVSNVADHKGMQAAMEKLSGMGDNSRGRIDEEDGA